VEKYFIDTEDGYVNGLFRIYKDSPYVNGDVN